MIRATICVFATAALGLATSACSGETTPAGPLGSVHDVRSLLPSAVRARAPTDEAARSHEQDISVGDPPAMVTVRWRSFVDGSNAYLLSVAFDVKTPANGTKLDAGVTRNPVNRGTPEAVLQENGFTITWSRSRFGGSSAGTVSGALRADGTHAIH